MSATDSLDLTAAPPTSFVGRRHELAEARRLLGSTRVLSLVGTGGAGKTRLALRLAADVRRRFRDGVCVVLLADLRDPSLLELAVAEQLQLHNQSGRPAMETVIEHLAERDLLLVLDNCEHLIDACGRFVDQVTRACPGVRVLTTSRQSLWVPGEVTMSVPPMEMPEAVHLFEVRVAASMPAFTVTDDNAGAIGRICRRLDGLPLAIELAAARVRVLSPEQIERRLEARYSLLTQGNRGAPERQQTLRGMVDWSYDLCSAEERQVWARASVFSGGFDLEAAEHVCGGDGLDPAGMLDLIDSLADKSILLTVDQGDAMRYRMLETLREYGAERLEQEGNPEAVRRRHRDWCLDVARTWRETWEGPDQLTLVARLHREHANLRVALDFCLRDEGEVVPGFLIATCLDDYWGMRGLHTEVRRWLDQALLVERTPSPARAAALRLNGWYALLQGDLENGVAALTEAQAVAAGTGDGLTTAYVAHAWGMAALFTGDLDRAEALVTEALADFRMLGEVRGEIFSLFILGMTVGLAGDTERGLALLDECIAEASRRGEGFWRAYALWAVCQIEVARGGLPRAEETGKQALEIQRALDNRLAIAFCVDTLAWVAEQQGRHDRAARLFGAADAVWDAIGGSPANFATVAGPHDCHIAESRAALGPDSFDAAFREGHALPLDAALDYALGVAPSEPAPGTPEVAPTPDVALTRRETQVAALVAKGLTNKEIAARLVISPRTAEGHVEHILVKLGNRSRSQIAAWYAATYEKQQE